MLSIKMGVFGIFILAGIIEAFEIQETKLKPPAPEFVRHSTVTLSNFRVKRHIVKSPLVKKELSITLPFNGKDTILDLKLNTDFVKTTGNSKNSIKEEEICEYIGKVRGIESSRVALSVCGEPATIQGTVYDGKDTFYVEPATNGGKDTVYYIYNRRDMIKKDIPHSTLHVNRPRVRRGINFLNYFNSIFYGSRIKSNSFNDQTFTSKAQDTGRSTNIYDFTPKFNAVKENRFAIKKQKIYPPKKNAVLRVLLVVGATVEKEKGKSNSRSLNQYCRRLMNEVYSFYMDLGVTVKLAGVKQIVYGVENKIIDKYNKNSESPVFNFRDYMERNKLSKEYAFDAAVFLSEDVFSSSTTVGLAFTASICTNPHENAVAAVSTKRSWFMTSTTVAHELGHVLGLHHEEQESAAILGCPNKKNKFIMAAFGEPDEGKWSECSKQAWRRVVVKGDADCLMARPPMPDSWKGRRF